MEIPTLLVEQLKTTKSVVFFTGAGISAESGIPTFRGNDGIWKNFRPEELAKFDAFIRNPELVWKWYNYRKTIIHNSRPNDGHYAIVEFEEYFDKVIVITQNVDNLHRRAGSKTIFELHGNIEKNYCVTCKKRYDYDLEFNEGVPRCTCGGFIRPDVVWFGEFLPADQFQASENAARNCDVFFIVGTSAVVYPAASLIGVAKNSGAFLVEVNIEETDATSLADVSLFGKSGEVLPLIVEQLKLIDK